MCCSGLRLGQSDGCVGVTVPSTRRSSGHSVNESMRGGSLLGLCWTGPLSSFCAIRFIPEAFLTPQTVPPPLPPPTQTKKAAF